MSGLARPYEILAILGASGSGKTTLLNALNMRNRGALTVEGEVRVNGKLIRSMEEITCMSGYVQQNDLFIGTLRVGEHLIFQVRVSRYFSPSSSSFTLLRRQWRRQCYFYIFHL